MRRRPSIRLRLIIVAALSIVATLAVAGVSLVSVFERQILRRVEQELETRWTELAAAFVLDAEGRPALERELTDPRYHQPLSGAFWQITEAGQPVLTSRSLWDEGIDTTEARRQAEGAFEAYSPDGDELYVVARPVVLGDDRRFELAVALDHAEVEALSAAFGFDVLRILGPIAIILGIAAWFQLRHGLSPLRRLDRDLQAVHDGSRARLPLDVPSEVEPVVSDLNRLLDRQDQLIRKARDRAGVLAHGLKTPLTIIGAELRRLERAGQGEGAARIAGQVDLIRGHVDRELARARTAGAAAAAGASADAHGTVERLLRLMRHMPRGDELTFENAVRPGLTVRMDPDDFGETVGNLVDNARKFARTRVVVRDVIAGGETRIAVEDDGPGFAADGQPYGERGIVSPNSAESTGLGLGIVRDILAEYGLSLEVRAGAAGSVVSFATPADASRPAGTGSRRAEAQGAGGEPAGAVRDLPGTA